LGRGKGILLFFFFFWVQTLSDLQTWLKVVSRSIARVLKCDVCRSMLCFHIFFCPNFWNRSFEIYVYTVENAKIRKRQRIPLSSGVGIQCDIVSRQFVVLRSHMCPGVSKRKEARKSRMEIPTTTANNNKCGFTLSKQKRTRICNSLKL